jgi:hypothetical protein
MEAICFSQTSVDFQRTIRRYTPEDIALTIRVPPRSFPLSVVKQPLQLVHCHKIDLEIRIEIGLLVVNILIY